MILGAVLLTISAFSTTYVNYVKPGFRPLLVGAGAVLVGLGLLSVVQGWLGRPGAHGHGPRVAWLLAAPVFAIVMIAPPALGSYAAQQAPPPAPPALVDAQPVRPLKSDRVNVLSLAEFADRAWYEPIRSLAGKTVRLTGFVLPSPTKAEWYIARMRISCCAADALTMKVIIRGAPAPATDTWVRVTGTWIPREGRPSDTYVPAMTASDVHPISPPVEPYE